jgi:hypothetical protein
MPEQWAATDLVEHLRDYRLHSGAASGGEDDDRGRSRSTHWDGSLN